MQPTRRRTAQTGLVLAALVLLLAAAALAAFCWWGLYTAAGRQRFDEMDGIYPLLAGVVGAMAALAAGALLLVAWARR